MILKIIIFVILLFIVIRFFSRLLLSMFIGNITNKFTQAQSQHHHNSSRRKDGNVIITSSHQNDKKYKTTEGEYVDFEEIKE